MFLLYCLWRVMTNPEPAGVIQAVLVSHVKSVKLVLFCFPLILNSSHKKDQSKHAVPPQVGFIRLKFKNPECGTLKITPFFLAPVRGENVFLIHLHTYKVHQRIFQTAGWYVRDQLTLKCSAFAHYNGETHHQNNCDVSEVVPRQQQHSCTARKKKMYPALVFPWDLKEKYDWRTRWCYCLKLLYSSFS